MTCTEDGFSAWGKDMGGYSSNPTVMAENEETYHHQTGGMAEIIAAASQMKVDQRVLDKVEEIKLTALSRILFPRKSTPPTSERRCAAWWTASATTAAMI